MGPKTTRRGLMAGAAMLLPLPGLAQGGFPDKPIRIIVPFPPGGGTDNQARAFADALSREMPQRVVVDNRAGAGGNIGVDAAARSAADGYTLLATGPNIINTRYLIRDTPFRWERDFDTLGLMFSSPNVLVVHPSVPARTVPELIAYLKANPGKVNFASAGAGGSIHLSGELFMTMTGTQMVHVSYRGDALARADLTNGNVQLMFNTLVTSVQPIQANQWRGLAVTGETRNASLPELPTVAEAGVPGFSVISWMGLFAPKGIPADAVASIRAGFDKVFAKAQNRAEFAQKFGVDVIPSTGAQHLAFMQAEERKWAPILSRIEPA
ncbi:MAG TPA: tripartite tricarboxylate transporter substrate binding protein [Falsiroseomonas sp.]|jgi:tripartite-type tricarboxylate transporter receptor subunit TctC|nr:tripartite tricarboxylate transporter substrate binding protein [Falsiroseomonas sp.]